LGHLVKRAIRALESPAYEKARTKNALLPPVTNRAEAENCFKLLPLSLLALRVQKVDPNAGHEGHAHAPPDPKKRVKGLWTVTIVQQQEAGDDMHYMWLWEGPQWRKKLYAVGALALIMTVVMFPLWPLVMRQGVWYLSMGMLGLLGLFFVMAIFRLILFCITMFTHAPGLWLYPNLFEDVGFFDSFRPLWAWHEVCLLSFLHLTWCWRGANLKLQDPAEKRKQRREKRAAKAEKVRRKATGGHEHSHEHNHSHDHDHSHNHDHSHDHNHSHEHLNREVLSSQEGATGTEAPSSVVQRRVQHATVEEGDSD
jgi:translocation protein SEC62